MERQKVKPPGFSITYAGIFSALFFAFALGIFYAAVREKTGSLLGPILAHNISDGWLSILYIIIQSIQSIIRGMR